MRTWTFVSTVVTTLAAFNYTACGRSNPSWQVGDAATVCLQLNGQMMAAFSPKVDQYKAIVLQGANYGLPGGTGYIYKSSGWVAGTSGIQFNCSLDHPHAELYVTVDVSVGGITSTSPRIYKKIVYDGCDANVPSTVYSFPLLTAIISLDQGVPSYVDWDDGCFFCAENGPECMEYALDTATYAPFANDELRSCAQEVDSCYSDDAPAAGTTPSPTPTSQPETPVNVTLPTSSCDLKVFLVWTGTDKNGQYLTSAGKRFSRFRQYATATTYQGAIFLAQEVVDKAKTAAGMVDGVPGRLFPGTRDERRLIDAAAGDVGPFIERVPTPSRQH